MKTIRQTLFSFALACAVFAQATHAQEKAAPAQPATAQQSAPAHAVPQKLVTQGVEIEFNIEPAAAGAAQLMEEQDVRVRFRVNPVLTAPTTGCTTCSPGELYTNVCTTAN